MLKLDVTQEDDDIVLPPDTLAFLQEFLAEKAEREKQESLLLNGGTADKVDGIRFSAFEEDWQLSQFWYNDATKQTLSAVCKKLINNSDSQTKIALLSCPSLYDSIRKLDDAIIVRLFEFDRRFSCYGQDFVFYDYKSVTDNPEYMSEYHQQFDIVLMDPPFLSEECISKLAQTVKLISKPTAKLILCSGEVVEEWASKYLGLKKCLFQPEHERNLGNMFASYANFQMDTLIP
ncbi:protein-lysine N-methyltransferase CG9154 [Bradysia coprophila]|uniref:protein-lysine N-methyltransferase CG9154 n=1 Tax=Bradysia coprophila TaxID=38358 RepID=UPI00187DBED6|nr:protein-lysine N-methyltransferase CG9154 [Bradysia coprophila]